MVEDDLKTKYGRRKKETEVVLNEKIKKEINEHEYDRDNVYTKKTKKNLTAKEKEIKKDIKNVINQYKEDKANLSSLKIIKTKNEETFFVKFLKIILILGILLCSFCITISFIKKSDMNSEADKLVELIKKAENIYYSKTGKYHYLSKTTYDRVLGIDLSNCVYFYSYEVLQGREDLGCEINLYGPTNVFTVTYAYIKSLIKK